MNPIALVCIIVGSVLLLLLIIFLCWWFGTINSMRKMNIKVDEAESGIDVALTKRYDLLTKEVAVVKGYAKHEAETLEKVVAMRQPEKNAPMADKTAFANEVTKAFDSINVVMERYPDLKANTNFLNLQNQIADVEEQLQAARRLYNANVSTYNQKIIVFPSSIVAKKYSMIKRDFFEAENAKRADVKIEF